MDVVKIHFVKDGADIADFDIDNQDCIRSTQNTGLLDGQGIAPMLVGAALARLHYKSCMKARGWKKYKVEKGDYKRMEDDPY